MRLGELPSGVVCITFLAAILTSCADDGEGPLTITAHPTDQSVVEGETATFSVAATGSGTPTYQWQRDGAVIPGGTGASHTTPAATLADDGAQFTCVVTNADWSMTSNPATLRVTTLLPTILAQPSDLTVAEGRTATFVVAATGSGTLTYQWRRGGTDIPGATDASYTTPATTSADDGAQFTCAVTNAPGTVTSNAATLTVQPLFYDIGAGLMQVWPSSLAWGDYDSDGDLDLVLAGYDGGYLTKVYRNDGGVFTDTAAALTGVGYSSLAWGDYDNDGDLDLALAGYVSDGNYISKIYRNDGGTFTDIGAGLTGVEYCALAWGDYDNDGDLDLALAGSSSSGYVSKVYNNDSGTFTDVGAGLVGAGYCSLAWGDYDNDGDLDLALAGEAVGGGYLSAVYRNDGGTFTDIDAGLTAVGFCSVAWGDYDNDGDLDLALAGAWGGGPSYQYEGKVYRNDGGTFVDIAAELAGVANCTLAWGDYDNDGDLDLALSGFYQDGALYYISRVYRNDGGTFADIGAGLIDVGYWGSVAWGDYDDDGDLDLAVAGGGDGGGASKVYRNNGGVFNTAPAAPTGLSAGVSGSDATFSWSAATDSETPSAGLTYNLRVGTTPGGDEVMSGHAITSPDARLIPAMGNVQHNLSWTLTLPAGTYYWSVQAVDTAFAGGAWAAEESVAAP